MNRRPLAICGRCQLTQLAPLSLEGINAPVKLKDNIFQGCSRCGGTTRILDGTYSLTPRGVLIEPLDISFDELLVAIEVIQTFGNTELTPKDVRELDKRVKNKTKRGKSVFSKIYKWFGKSKPHQYLYGLALLVAACSGEREMLDRFIELSKMINANPKVIELLEDITKEDTTKDDSANHDPMGKIPPIELPPMHTT